MVILLLLDYAQGQLQEEQQGYGGKQEQEKLDNYEAQDEGGRTSSVQTSYVSVLDQVQQLVQKPSL